MKLALHKYFLSLFASNGDEDEEDRADDVYIQMCKRENPTFRPLRDVFDDIEAEEREVQRRVKQSS